MNATSAFKITHHFVNDMLDKRMPGLVTFTSSSAGFIPCPMSVLYGATKAFLTEFAASLAAEIKGNGIDVVVVHPSPVDRCVKRRQYAGRCLASRLPVFPVRIETMCIFAPRTRTGAGSEDGVCIAYICPPWISQRGE